MIPTGPCVSMARATGLEPATPPNKHGLKRTSIALNGASGGQDVAALVGLVRTLSRLASEDKVLLAALLLGGSQGGDPK